MPPARVCPQCGTEIAGDAPDGMCPKCVLAAVFDSAVPTAPESGVHLEPLLEEHSERIGRYKLLQKIGEGGCGVVYMAEQTEPVRRRVALKVIKLGMDSRQVVARFEAERQALALMDHPHIAKVLDGGVTETGRPFFVMELVKGIPITRYCDEHKLDTKQRLELFIQVCKAIQHAHSKEIIHRDIKPSNVLVADLDGVPVPKVIDFGIAKATAGQILTDKTLFTALEQFIGTPTYMSPEQAQLSALDVDKRSDVYSLGVLLYELLTGSTPFDVRRLMLAGFDEVRRIIREEEPVRPSTRLTTLEQAEQKSVARQRQCEPPKLVGMIRGDLDWIVMKTLEKDRSRRYETADELAADVGRFLHDEPIEARPPSKVYRLQKLVRRHKLAFGAASAIATALVIAGAALAYSWNQSRNSSASVVSIAVLPFTNASPEKIEPYLSDSLTAELLSELWKIPGVNAFQLTASRSTESPDKMLDTLAQLHVRFLVEGRVKWSAGKITIGASLVEPATGNEVVLTNYEREPKDVLGVPNQLTLKIAEHANISLPAKIRDRIRKTPTQSPEAYDGYLRGRYDLITSFLLGPGTNAIPAFERAVDLDPQFALAFAHLSRAYVLQYFYFKPEEKTVLESKAFNAFTRAEALDSDLPEAHFAKGYFYWTPSQHWNVEKAIQEYRLALKLSPRSVVMWDQLGLIYLHSGLFEEARKLATTVFEINPLNPLTTYLEANRLFWLGRDSEAVAKWEKLPDKSAKRFIMNSYEAVALINLSRTNDATRLIEASLRADPNDIGGLFASVEAILLAKQGDESGAIAKINSALDQSKTFGHAHHAIYNIACAYALLNRPSEAMIHLERAAEDGLPCFPLFEHDQNLNNLRTNKAFIAFRDKQEKLFEKRMAQFASGSSKAD